MAIHFVGTSIGECSSYDSGHVVVGTTATDLAPYVPEGIQIDYQNNSEGADTPDISIQTDFDLVEGWVSFYIDFGDFSGNNWDHNVVALRDSRDTSKPILRINKPKNSQSLVLFYATGSGEGNVSLSYPILQLSKIDIYFKLNTDGVGGITIYKDGTLWVTYTGVLTSTGGLIGFNQLTFQREGGDNSSRTVSAIIIADEDTRDFKVQMDYATGNGFHTDYTGDYLNIDGTGLDDTDHITSNLQGDQESFTFPSLHADFVGTSLKYAGIVTSSQSLGTLGVQAITRINSVTYSSPTFASGSGSNKGYSELWAVNPSTGVAWTKTEIESAEFGVKAGV